MQTVKVRPRLISYYLHALQVVLLPFEVEKMSAPRISLMGCSHFQKEVIGSGDWLVGLVKRN